MCVCVYLVSLPRVYFKIVYSDCLSLSLFLALFLSLFLSYLKSVRRRLGTTVVERELQNILSAGVENGSMIPGCVVCLEVFEIPQPVAFCRVCAGGFVH